MDSNLCLCKRPACPDPLNLHASRTFVLNNRHLAGKAVDVVHGQQGTADWHRQRLYRIGGSSARACAHARTHSSRAKCAAKACGCDSSSAEAAALEWGKIHESTAVYCYTQQLQQPGGTAIAWYKGPVPSNGAFWSEKKYVEYLQLDVAVHEPGLTVDSGIQVGPGEHRYLASLLKPRRSGTSQQDWQLLRHRDQVSLQSHKQCYTCDCC